MSTPGTDEHHCENCKSLSVWYLRYQVKTNERYASGEYKYETIRRYACSHHITAVLSTIGKGVSVTVRGLG